MCTLVLDRRPDHPWPLVLAGNRDEMADRPWKAPDRHWPDRPEVLAGLDETAGGSWLGVNDWGVVACILNRRGTLGPAPGLRSRGDLVLEALDHADAVEAAAALADLDPRAYRPFNLVVADTRDAFWVRHTSSSATERIAVIPLSEGLSMLTADDLNDPTDPRVRSHLPRFHEAPRPDPENGPATWRPWQQILATRTPAPGEGPEAAMCFSTPRGFGTVSAACLAVPAVGRGWGGDGVRPVFLFAAGPPDQVPFQPIVG